jgi:hypothetical protein
LKTAKSILILIILLSAFQASAQDINYLGYKYSSRFHYGFIVPHHPPVKYLRKGHTPIYELTVSKRMDGSKKWHSNYRHPWLGLGYNYSNFQYNEVLGSAHSLFSVIQIPIIERDKWMIDYSFSYGLGYVSKVFDVEENYYNIVIGSHFNAFLKLGFDISHNLSKDLKASYGISFQHYSNGSVRKPNLGINQVALSLALSYEKYNKDWISILHRPTTLNYRNEFLITGSGGWKQISVASPKIYPTFSSSINYERILKKKHIGLGYDLFFDGSLPDVENKNAEFTGTKADRFRNGIHISYGLAFGKTVFTIQTGYYLLLNHNTDGHLYNRFGLRYYFNNNMVANITLKTHLGVADFVEWGIGYYIRRI